MAFTCPDCLMISQGSPDVAENYCGGCHAYVVRPPFHPTLFQTSIIRAMRHHDPQIAVMRMLRVVAQSRMQLTSYEEIYRQLGVLLEAPKVARQHRARIVFVRKRILAATGNSMTFDSAVRGSSPPSNG